MLGNKFEQPNQINRGDSDESDEFDLPKSKRSEFRQRGSVGSKRTVGGRLRRSEETKKHHNSTKVARTGSEDEENIMEDPPTKKSNLSVKKSRTEKYYESSDCDES